MTINHSELLSVVPGGADTQHHVDGANHTYLTSTEESGKVGTTLNGTLSEHATAIDGLKDGTLIEDNAIKANHITNASVSLAKINPAGASEGQVLGFSGGSLGWQSSGGADGFFIRSYFYANIKFIARNGVMRVTCLGGGGGGYRAGNHTNLVHTGGQGGGSAVAFFNVLNGQEIEVVIGSAGGDSVGGTPTAGGDSLLKINGVTALTGYGGKAYGDVSFYEGGPGGSGWINSGIASFKSDFPYGTARGGGGSYVHGDAPATTWTTTFEPEPDLNGYPLLYSTGGTSLGRFGAGYYGYATMPHGAVYRGFGGYGGYGGATWGIVVIEFFPA